MFPLVTLFDSTPQNLSSARGGRPHAPPSFRRMGPGRQRGPFEKESFHAEDGSFAVDDVPAGRWTVEAFSRGYQSGSAAGVVVGEGEAAEGVEVRLSRGSVVAKVGRVSDSGTKGT